MDLPSGYLRILNRFEIFGIKAKIMAGMSNKTELALLAREFKTTLLRHVPESYFWNITVQDRVNYCAEQNAFFEVLLAEQNEHKDKDDHCSEIAWILKREGTSRGRGISLLPKNVDISALRKPEILNVAHVVQRYLQEPCLLPSAKFPGQGYKFDLRLYGLCVYDHADGGRLQFFKYYKGFARRCQRLFQLETLEHGICNDKDTHVTNTAVNAKNGDRGLLEYMKQLKEYLKSASDEEKFLLPNLPDDYSDEEYEIIPTEEENAEVMPKTMLVEDAFNILLNSKKYSVDAINQMRRDIDILLQDLFRSVVAKSEVYLMSTPPKQAGLEYRKHFALLGIDVILDKNLKPWLLEVNRFPDLRVYSMLQLNVKKRLIRDTLSLVFPDIDAKKMATCHDSLELDLLFGQLNPSLEEVERDCPCKVDYLAHKNWERINVSLLN